MNHAFPLNPMAYVDEKNQDWVTLICQTLDLFQPLGNKKVFNVGAASVYNLDDVFNWET